MEYKLNSLKTFKDRGVFICIGMIIALFAMLLPLCWGKSEVEEVEEDIEKPFVACYGCSHYDADTNSCIDDDKWSKRCEAGFPTDTLEERWYPGELTEDGDHQKIPEVSGTSHEKFKELCRLYGLDASKIWELENKYNLREGVLLAILVSETSGGYNGAYVNEGCYNLGNVGNRDNGDRVCFKGKWESIEKVAQTLNNKYLGHAITLGCLSNAGSCYWRDDTGHRYATSEGNWEKNMKAVLNAIYQEELGEEVDPSRFVVKRVLFQ